MERPHKPVVPSGGRDKLELETRHALFILRAVKWISPVIVVSAAASTAYWRISGWIQRIEDTQRALLERIEGLEKRFDSEHAFGPAGFTDGRMRAAVNATIRSETGHLVPRDELDRRFQRLYDLNPGLKP